MARVDEVMGTVTVLRHGAVGLEDLRRALEGSYPKWRVGSQLKGAPVKSPEARENGRVQTEEAEAAVSPGQEVRHYAPDVT